jgi:hypothetical protein
MIINTIILLLLSLGRKELTIDILILTKFLEDVMLLMYSTVTFSSGLLLNKFLYTHTHARTHTYKYMHSFFIYFMNLDSILYIKI